MQQILNSSRELKSSIVKCQSVPELSSNNMCLQATMAMMGLDKAETQNKFDNLGQAVDSLRYPLTAGLQSFNDTLNIAVRWSMD